MCRVGAAVRSFVWLDHESSEGLLPAAGWAQCHTKLHDGRRRHWRSPQAQVINGKGHAYTHLSSLGGSGSFNSKMKAICFSYMSGSSLPSTVTFRASTRWQSGCCCGCRTSWKGWRREQCSVWEARSTCSFNKPWTPKTSADSSQGGKPGCRPDTGYTCTGYVPAFTSIIRSAHGPPSLPTSAL